MSAHVQQHLRTYTCGLTHDTSEKHPHTPSINPHAHIHMSTCICVCART